MSWATPLREPAKRAQHQYTNVTVENLTIFTLDQTTANMLQHVATRRNWMAKRAQHAASNNVVICWVEMLPLTDNST